MRAWSTTSMVPPDAIVPSPLALNAPANAKARVFASSTPDDEKTYVPLRLLLLNPFRFGGVELLLPQPAVRKIPLMAASAVSTRLAHLREERGFIRHSCLYC